MQLLLLISYDICNDKSRNKISKELERLGFTRLQYSVFAGTATETQWRTWRKKLEALFNRFYEEGDKLYMIPQSERMFKQTQMIGTPFDPDWVAGNTQTLYY